MAITAWSANVSSKRDLGIRERVNLLPRDCEYTDDLTLTQ